MARRLFADPVAAAGNPLSRGVSGRVTDADGQPIVGALVVVQTLRLKKPLVLASARSEKDGRYVATFNATTENERQTAQANAVLEVRTGAAERLVASVPFDRRGKVRAIVDVALRGDEPLAGRIARKLMEVGGPADGRISPDQHDAVAKLTSLARPAIERFSRAASVAARLAVPTDFAFAVLRRTSKAVEPERALFTADPAQLTDRIAQAVARGEIAPIAPAELRRTIAQIQKKSVEVMKTATVTKGQLPMGELLRLAGSDAKTDRQIARLFHRHVTAPARFWRSLLQDALLTKAVKTRIQDAVDLSAISAGNFRIAEALRAIPAIREPRDAAFVRADDLDRGLRKILGVSGPRAKTIAAGISARARETFPTAGHLADLSVAAKRPAVALLDALHRDSTFDLVNTAIEAHLTSTTLGKSLGAAARSGLIEQLKQRQRVARLGASYKETKALLKSGFGSAAEIVAKGVTAFTSAVTKAIGDERAREIHLRAEETHAKAASLLMAYGPMVPSTPTIATPALTLDWDNAPTLATLFQDHALCACDRCRSITGPAAYLVDLLQWLRRNENNAPSGVNALDTLTSTGPGPLETRRPDLTGIELSCENTNTQIPYLDIVLEVLENAVVSPAAAATYQTHASQDEIAAASEHLNPDAYVQLGKAVYPFNLPFDIAYEELRVTLAKLGTTRLELMEAFPNLARVDDPDSTREYLSLTSRALWEREDVAGEVFGLGRAERRIITGQALTPGVVTPGPAFWGYRLQPNWLAKLTRLDVFMQRSGLTYLEVVSLLSMRALLGSSHPTLTSTDPAECDPSRITIDGLTAESVERLHRFIRLRRRAGWTMRDLDRALFAVGPRGAGNVRELDKTFLIRLSHVHRLVSRFGCPIPEVLAWWSDLDTADYNGDHLPSVRSFYADVFERETPALSGSASLPLHDVLDGIAGTIDSNTDQLLAILRLSTRDLEALNVHLADAGQQISLTNLSLLFRHTSLARQLGLTVPDYLTFRSFAGDPFVDEAGDASTLRTLAFLERYDSFVRSGVSLDDLASFLGGDVTPPGGEEEFRRDIATAPGAPSSPEQEANIIQRVGRRFGIDLAIAQPLLREWLSFADGNPFLDVLAALDDPAIAPRVDALISEAYRRLGTVRWFMDLVDGLTLVEAQWAFTQAPSAGFSDIAALPVTPADDIARAATCQAWRRWEQWLELRRRLPKEKRDDLIRLFALGNATPSSSTAGDERDAYNTALAAITGWSDGDIVLLAGKFDSGSHRFSTLNTSFRHHFRDEQLPLQMARGVALAKRIGLSLVHLSPDSLMYREPVTFPGASVRAGRSALRTRIGDADWPAAAAAVRDFMREKQRRALVDYLVAKWDLRDSGALFDHFLLDVEMNASRKTTRIQAATHSVQLFVDRCLMNLEPDVRITSTGAEQWEWMKRYSIWEAARRIFLRPESYLRQEFRDDQTPFFRDLVNELRQTDVTNETAEAAFLHYVDKVDHVSRLQISGIYVEEAADAKNSVPDCVHVFGRTRNTPSVYFYRQWRDFRWTAWERVDVDVEGDHLIPVVYFGKVYLFWPVISEKDGGPFNIEAFLRPLIDVLNLVAGAAKAGAGAAYTLIHAFNRMVQSIEDGVNALPGANVGLGGLKLPEPDTGLDHPLETVLDLIGTGLKTVFDVELRSYLAILDLLPKKEYGIQLAWSSYRSGTWSAKKLSPTHLDFADVTGPFLRKIHEAVPASRDQLGGADAAFDRKRLFTLNARIEGQDQLVIQAHVTRLGVNPAGEAVDDAFSAFLGDFVLDDAHSSALARRRQGGSVEFLGELVENLQEVTFGVLQSALQFIAGEPISQDDNLQGTLKRDVVSPLLSVPAQHYRLIGAHQYQARNVATVAASRELHAGSYVGPDGHLDNQFFLQTPVHTFWCWRGSFQTHYHPFVSELMQQLNRHGLEAPGLMDPQHQNRTRADDFTSLGPRAALGSQWPAVDFEYQLTGAYAVYNWEIFVHAPLLIAEQLMAQHRHREAERWLHFVFDPSDRRDVPSPMRFWRPRVFAETSSATYHQQTIDQLSSDLAGGAAGEAHALAEAQVRAWRRDPFEPFALARVRTTAFQRGVVILYIQNLLAWGDQLFRSDDTSSDVAALLLYRRAEQILGRRPDEIAAPKTPAVRTYDQLRNDLDSFSNALVELEHRVAFPPVFGAGQMGPSNPPVQGIQESGPRDRWRGLIDTAWFTAVTKGLYFCIPRDEKLLELWTTLADRQQKIRSGQDIDGAARSFGTDDRTIDPERLIRARRTGMDVTDLLNQQAVPEPRQRFTVMVQRALELANDVRNHGAALLSAFEKRDAEQLAQFKNDQERDLLTAIRDVRLLAISEAEATVLGLKEAKRSAELRRDHYFINLAMPISSMEFTQLALYGTGIGLQLIEAAVMDVASVLSLVPDVLAGFPVTAVQTGGVAASSASERAGKALATAAAIVNATGSMVGIMAGYERRGQEWALQVKLAGKEIDKVERQIRAAELRLDIARTALVNHDIQIEQNRNTAEFLADKFTREDLYSYMVESLSALYSDSYGLAFDIARQAETAFRLEMCEPLELEPRQIATGAWDSLRAGLLAGEKLHAAVRRLEIQYHNRPRAHEITKHISLKQYFPAELIRLVQSGTCDLSLPEWLFDMDYPGHYRRRIRSVGISIPCVAGPYTGINCTLILRNNRMRVSDEPLPVYEGNDSRFYEHFGREEAIVTSHGRSDGGLFQVDLNDARYLPFEGAGVESTWRVELPRETNYFDLESVSDIVLHINYEATRGSEALRQAAMANLRAKLPKNGVLWLDLTRSFPSEWNRFLNPPDDGTDQQLGFELTASQFPFVAQNRRISVRRIHQFAWTGETISVLHQEITAPRRPAIDMPDLSDDGLFGTLLHSDHVMSNQGSFSGPWVVKLWLDGAGDRRSLTTEDITRLVWVLEYDLNEL